jgi:hypothetical protein
LVKRVNSPSGVQVDVVISFGAEFFRVFFWLLKTNIRRILCVGEIPTHELPWFFNHTSLCS